MSPLFYSVPSLLLMIGQSGCSSLCYIEIIPSYFFYYFEITKWLTWNNKTWLTWSVTRHMRLQAFNQSKTNCQQKAWGGVPFLSANQASRRHPPRLSGQKQDKFLFNVPFGYYSQLYTMPLSKLIITKRVQCLGFVPTLHQNSVTPFYTIVAWWPLVFLFRYKIAADAVRRRSQQRQSDNDDVMSSSPTVSPIHSPTARLRISSPGRGSPGSPRTRQQHRLRAHNSRNSSTRSGMLI